MAIQKQFKDKRYQVLCILLNELIVLEEEVLVNEIIQSRRVDEDVDEE
jgi:hypothetical protein